MKDLNGQDVWVFNKYRFSKNALGFLDNKSKARYAIVWIITWKAFDNLILILIVFNSLLLGMKDYLDPESLTAWN